MKFLFVFADTQTEWNCSQWRSLTPSDGINKWGGGQHEARCLSCPDFAQYGHPTIQQFVSRFDVINVQRNIFHEMMWHACDYWRALGKVVCADLDDDYAGLTPQNPAHRFWIRAKDGELLEDIGTTPVLALEEGLRHVDALISPNRLILEDWAHVVPGYRLPNYAQGEWYESIEQKPTPADDEPIIIGWGGSVSHWDSWWFSGLKEAMIPLLEKHPRLHWKICGNDFRLIPYLSGYLPADRWTHQPGVPPQEWPHVVASFDIGVAPLCGPGAPQSEKYDQRRSFIKASEYMLCGVPWLASPGVVYEDLDGKGGRCVAENSPQMWFDAVSDAVEHIAECKAEAARWLPWARENLTMQAHVNTYVQLFARIQAEKQARLGLRLPDVLYVGVEGGAT